ncbi:PKD domain-containing protein [Aridibaculum aurantiacum]|uniref:PKD domain-containing protein n=1 Tax=Aridibaculum aurantiacum TaxID=2810307 RepID=UPI001A96378F|nr:PKD-like domain-containing protein [Aridibaculum aurantiacum]
MRRFLLFIWLLILVSFAMPANAGIELIRSGSYLVNMGVVPQTVGNGLKPYGLVYDLLKNHNVPVKWVINPSKGKDGVDFSHNGTLYAGGTFVIPAEYRTPAVNAVLASWAAQGVVGNTSSADLSLPVYKTLTHAPTWVLDRTSGSLAVAYFNNAGIPASAYGGSSATGWKDPSQLTACDDIFVMPHADVSWNTHNNLRTWNSTAKGNIWTGCHAASQLENITDAGGTTQLNFLTTTGMVPATSHQDGTLPFQYGAHGQPVMQFVRSLDNAVNNGTEKVYLPQNGGAWRPTTTLGVFNNSHTNIPGLSAGPSAALAFGRGFGNNNNGWVMYEAGHNLNNTGTIAERVAAQRAFFNFSFFSAADKNAAFDIQLNNIPQVVYPATPYNISFTVPSTVDLSAYSIQWTSSNGGSFSPSANQQNVVFTSLPTSGYSIISVSLTDACGRVVFASQGIYTCPDNFTPANAGADRMVCLQDTIHLAGNAPTAGTGTWRQISGPNTAVIANVNQPNSTVSNLVAGTYTFTWSIGNSACTGTPDTVVITMSAATVAGTTSGAANVCAGANSGNVLLNNHTGSVVQWEQSTNNGTTWTAIANTTASLAYTNLTTTTWYRALVRSGACASLYSSHVAINTFQPVTIADAGPDRTTCLQDTIKLNNNLPAIGTGSWSMVSGPSNATFTVENDTSVLGNLKNGTYTLVWTISNGVCPPSTDTVIINIQSASPNCGCNVSFPPDLVDCNNSTVVTANNPNYRPVYSSNNPSDRYSWTITGGPFSYQAGSGKNSRFPNINFQSGYIYTISVEFTNPSGTCRATMTMYRSVAINAEIIQPVNNDTTITCMEATQVNLLGSVAGPYNSIVWRTTGTGTFNNTSILNPVYTFSAADRLNGMVRLTMRAYANINGNCSADDSAFLIVRITPTVIGRDTSIARCSNTPVDYMPFATPSGSTFSWTSQVISGNVSGNSDSGTNRINDVLINHSSFEDAVVQYTVIPYNGPCVGNPFTVIVRVRPNPVVPVSDLTLCTGTAMNVPVADSIGTSTYTWSSSVVSGNASGFSQQNTPVPATTIADVLINTTNAPAVVRYRITAVSAYECSGPPSEFLVNVYPQVSAAVAGADRSICAKDSVHLNATPTTSGTSQWYQYDGPTTADFANYYQHNSAVSSMQAGTYQFIWQVTNDVCPDSRDTVIFQLNESTVAGIAEGDATACYGANTGNVELTGYAGDITHWESSTNNGATWTVINNTSAVQPYNNITATTWYRALVQNATCAAEYSNHVVVTVVPQNTVANAGPDATICLPATYQLAANTPTSGAGTWSQVSGPSTVVFANNGQPTTNISGLTPGVYSFEWTIANGICEDSRDTVVITIDSLTVAGTTGVDTTVCATANSGIITLSGNVGSIVRWEASTDNGATWTNFPNTTTTENFTGLTTTTWYRALVQSGVCAALYSDTTIITVVPAVTPANAGPDATVCLPATYQLAANTPTSGSGTWSQISGPSTVVFSNIQHPTSNISNLVPGTYSFEWTITNGICEDSKDTVLITIDSLTVAGTTDVDTTVCATANSGTITLSGNVGSIVRWEASTDNGATWTNIANTTATANFSGLTTTTWYRALVQSGVCAALYSDTTIITVVPAVTPANAGPDAIVCLPATYQLAANIPTSGIGTWSQVSGPSTVSFSSIQDPASSINNLVPGTYSFAWTISNGICADSRDTVVIELSSLTVPGTLADNDTVCAV